MFKAKNICLKNLDGNGVTYLMLISNILQQAEGAGYEKRHGRAVEWGGVDVEVVNITMA